MIDRQGNYIAYEGCVEITNGVFISDEGEVYIYDKDGVVAEWDHSQIASDPKVAAHVMLMIALAAKRGPGSVRDNKVDRGTTLRQQIKHVKYTQGQA